MHVALVFAAFLAVKSAAPPPHVVVDTHADTPTEYLRAPFDLGAWNGKGEVD